MIPCLSTYARYYKYSLNIPVLHRTGGIVQGMSGSPILQDGRIIGAVTHVYLSDATQGYGMYIEWMLEKSDALDAEAQAA